MRILTNGDLAGDGLDYSVLIASQRAVLIFLTALADDTIHKVRVLNVYILCGIQQLEPSS